MEIKQIFKLVDDVEIGDIFQYDGDIWIKTNSSHKEAGYQCVDLKLGSLMWLNYGTEVTKVEAELQVFTPRR